MKLFKYFLILFALVVVFVGVSRFFPHTYYVKRTVEINKPVDSVYTFMANLHNWPSWSLWNTTTDSTLKVFYNQRLTGLGARQYFHGNLIGEGRFEINVYEPNKTVGYNLYLNQGEAMANGRFIFETTNHKTTLHWVDSGDVGNNPLFRYMLASKVSSTEKTFDEGLLRIKGVLESR
ncbi:MAG: SRPBCC family protein [Bacteroidota bacterium]